MISVFKNAFRSFYVKSKFPKSEIAGSAIVSLDSTLGKDTRILSHCKIGNCNISRYTYVGAGSELTRTDIGPFTSIGSEVICGLGIHPVDFISTYPGFYSSHASGSTWFGSQYNVTENLRVEIGADVWIGTRAVILSGVRIGHGAVIGTGAIVTKDVPPYSIVVGVPAKQIRLRFDEETITKLIQSKWWELPDEKMTLLAKHISSVPDFLAIIDKIKNENQLQS